jgi:hypothetical protein
MVKITSVTYSVRSRYRASLNRRHLDVPRPVNGDGGELGGFLERPDLVDTRRSCFMRVEGEGAQHPAGGGTDRLRPASGQTGFRGQRPEGRPVGVGRDILDDDPLPGIGGRAAGTHVRAVLQAIDGPIIDLRQTGRDGGVQMPTRGVEQEETA